MKLVLSRFLTWTGVLSLLLLAVTTPTTTAKDCTTVSRGKELKQLIAKSNVLVALRKDDADTKELCERLQQTPEARVQDLEVVTVEDHNLQRKVWDSSRPAPQAWWERLWFALESRVPPLRKVRPSSSSTSATSTVETPSFVLFVQGEDNYDQANGIRYTGEDKSADGVTTFLALWLQTKKLGSYVYSLGTYDLIASQTMKWIQEYGTDGYLPRLWVHGVGKVTRYLVQPASMPFEAQLAQMYISAATKVLEHGPNYPQTQIDRLERMLGDDDSKISPIKREELSQRMFVWRKFAEPIEVSKEDFYKFVGRLVLNLFSVTAMAVMIPMLLFTKEEYEEEEEEEVEGEEEQANDDDDAGKETSNGDAANGEDEDSPTDETTKAAATSKEEKRAAAIQRAKQSMEEDKKKVEAVKAKKQQQGTSLSSADQASSSSTNKIYSREELNGMTVLQLREILKGQGSKVAGSKAELVDRVLGQN